MVKTDRTRVVVTGMGAVTPLGLSVQEFWKGLVEGRSGIGPMTLCDPSKYSCRIAGEVRGFDPSNYMDAKEARRSARFTQMGIAAARMALEDAHLQLEREDLEWCGVLLGNGNGSLPTIEDGCRIIVARGGSRLSPFMVPMMLPNMAAATISRLFNLQGYNSTVATSCAAGTQAIGEALEVIRRGAAQVMLAGGCEANICEVGLAGFCVMQALSSRNDEPTKASRPFDAKRDGFVPSEGAAVLILESLEHALKRGARIVAEVSGFGASSDAFHLVHPQEDGAGPARAISWALQDAGVRPPEVDYINAHGTSTPLNDASETVAIKRVFGEHAYRIPISATKSMTGHSMGAAGALEAVACVKTIQERVIHPTINYQYPDPKCDLDYVPNQARRKDVKVALSNSFGFGGQNACLVFRRYEG